MVLIYSIILTICYFSAAWKARNNIFSPKFIYNVYAWIKNVPYFIERGDSYSSNLVAAYFVYKLLSFVCINVGISYYQKRHAFNYRYIYKDRIGTSTYGFYFFFAVLLFVIGLWMKFDIINDNGGILYVITHIQSRKTMMAGTYYNGLFANSFLLLSVVFSEYYWLKRKNWWSKLLFVIILIVVLLSSMVFGARKPVLNIILIVFLVYHFCGKKVRIISFFKPHFLLIAGLLVLFVVMMPMLREQKETDLFGNVEEWAQRGVDKAPSVFKEFSYLEGEMFVFENFNHTNYWLGQSYKNILVQWIPRSFYPNKPPMDDGMYLWNMMQGLYVTPNQSKPDLFYDSSIPFTMEGALFLNFGVWGIVLGCFLIGCLYQKSYKLLLDSHYQLYTLLIYQSIMFTFVPSVLHTTSVIISIGTISIIMIPLLHIRIRKRKLYRLK